ncbi:ABC transporter permease [Paenirhodobacter sp.]|uniref:ABC transporter permease n=1 Tax=Paenirhodobacter sp. TaxID=1965326 RepID=UPI003B3DA832
MRIAQIIFGVLAVTFLMAPLLAILPLAFTGSDLLSYPIPSWSTRWFQELWLSDVWRRSIINSLVIGAGATALATVVGTLAALGLRRAFPGAELLRSTLLLPMVIPAVIIGVGMQIVFVRMGLTNTHLGVIIAHSVVALPFVVVNVSNGLRGIDTRVEQAALSLGAHPVKVFGVITLPLAMPGILSGAVLAFATSLDEVILTLFIAGPNQRTLARQMFSSIRENISPAIASAAFLFILGTIVIGGGIFLLNRTLRRKAL